MKTVYNIFNFPNKSMVRIPFLAMVLVAGWMISAVHAADFYVSSIHPNRSDANAGTSPDIPWASFDKVKDIWSSLEGGDTVHLERGSTWNLFFSDDYWNLSSGGGSAAKGHVVVRGDDYGMGEKPILRRAGGNGSSAFMLIEESYITFRDFELDGGNRGTLGIAIGSYSSDLSNVQILNMTIRNLGGNSSKYICGIWTTSPAGYTISDCLFEGNFVADYSAHGLNHYSPGPLVNIIWRNNIVRNSFTGGRYPAANSALQITSGGRNNVFEHNWLEDTTTTEGCILGFGKYASDTGYNTIRFNVIAHSDTYGILYTVDQNDKQILLNIYGNIIFDCDKSGLAIHPYNSYAPGTRFKVFNNTFVRNCTDGGDTSRGSMELDSQCANTTVDFANNLISQGNYGSSVALAVKPGFNGTLTHHNNLYWHEGGSSRILVMHNGTYVAANLNSYEASAQNGNPQLAEIANPPSAVNYYTGVMSDGYAVQASSPAVAKGANLGSSYAQDIERTSRGTSWTIGAYQYPTTTPTPAPTASNDKSRSVANDFNGDGISDIGCYDPCAGQWYIINNDEQTLVYTKYAGGTDTVPVTGDFDGDGICDYGTYNAPNGLWQIKQSANGEWKNNFGFEGTIPVTGDMDGDGIMDFGCYYPPTGWWFIYKSRDGFWTTQFGYEGTVPVVGDFDGDGIDDFGCYYAPGGWWYIYKSSTKTLWTTQFGYEGTTPVTGDFDGDSIEDFGCYDNQSGNWFLYKSCEDFYVAQLGEKGSTPITGDYDGDGRSDFGCYLASGGSWCIKLSETEQVMMKQLGNSSTLPLK